MEQTAETRVLDLIVEECIRYAGDNHCTPAEALEDWVLNAGASGVALTERQINLILERIQDD